MHSPYADFSFHTGVAYVDAVRLDNGTIWHADESVTVAELRQLQKDFDAKMLEERRQPGTKYCSERLSDGRRTALRPRVRQTLFL